MNYVLIKFHSTNLQSIDIFGYTIFETNDWNELKQKISNYDTEIRYPIVNCLCSIARENDLVFSCGKDFLKCCEEIKMNKNEYSSFVDLMPTYFGHHELFEYIENEVENV